MNDDKPDDKNNEHDKEPARAIAAVFGSREEAHQALGALHKAHFRKVWFGVTSIATTSQGTPAMTVEDAGFFSQKSQGLVDALVEHHVDGNAARGLVSKVEPGNALLTVDPEKHDPSEAMDILTRCGGRVEGGVAAAGAGMTASRQDVRIGTTSPGSVTSTATADDDLPAWEEEEFYQYPAR